MAHPEIYRRRVTNFIACKKKARFKRETMVVGATFIQKVTGSNFGRQPLHWMILLRFFSCHSALRQATTTSSRSGTHNRSSVSLSTLSYSVLWFHFYFVPCPITCTTSLQITFEPTDGISCNLVWTSCHLRQKHLWT